MTRVFRRLPGDVDQIQRATKPKAAGESVSYLFSFAEFPEAQAGETLASPSVPAVSGLTIGTPAVTAAARDYVDAGYGIAVTISGGTAGTTYTVACLGTFSGGAIRTVKGRIVVEA